jgi:hypothetical protein
MAQGDAREHPEYGAAVANALLVLIGPMALMLAGALMPQCSSDTNVTVRATGAPDLRGIVPVFLSMAWGLVPAAAVAGWRTLVLARRWREHERGDWRGVAEAGACGPAVALVVLAPGIVTRPAEAPPFVIAYGGAALVLGLVVGLILRLVALSIMRSRRPRYRSSAL